MTRSDSWLEAVRICHVKCRPDLVDSVVISAAKDTTLSLLDDINERLNTYKYCIERLALIRNAPQIDDMNGLRGGEDDDASVWSDAKSMMSGATNASAASNASSVVSTASVGSTANRSTRKLDWESGSAFPGDIMTKDEKRLLRRERKAAPKKNKKVKEGSANEESARAIAAVASIPDKEKRQQVKTFLTTLINLKLLPEAKKLQESFDHLLQYMINNSPPPARPLASMPYREWNKAPLPLPDIISPDRDFSDWKLAFLD